MIQKGLIIIFTAALVAALGVLSGFIALAMVCDLLAVAFAKVANGFIDRGIEL